MNIQECDIMKILLDNPFGNQRMLSEVSGHSLGVVNRSLRNLMAEGYLDEDMQLTSKATELRQKSRPRSAIILAAGFGMRMVPINLETPKAFLEVKGEPLIERQIRQLHEAGIYDIYVVVGFMKEKFDYLIDTYGVKLVVNRDYAAKNNLYSLRLVLDHLSDSYIVPCDIWCAQNPFSSCELYSWYLVSDRQDPDSDVRVNRRRELVGIGAGASFGYNTKTDSNAAIRSVKSEGKTGARSSASAGSAMIGIAYLQEEVCKAVRRNVPALCESFGKDGAFWEEALYERGRMIVPAKIVPASDYVEINTYEQLRELDGESNQLRSDVLNVIAQALDCGTEEIREIEVLKKGMTNRSFLFTVRDGKYIMRVPGEGTDQLINRHEEAEVYAAISGLGLCDDPVYIDPETGYKITRYLEGVRVCNADSEEDLRRCMARLRSFHEMGLKVEHSFDIFDQIEFYERLWGGRPSVYRDYPAVKERVLSLRPFIEAHVKERVLTHIDAVPDNFLFYRDGSGAELLQLTDWEYAGMQDPHVDIAMFCIYSMYDKEQVDHLIELYFAPRTSGSGAENAPGVLDSGTENNPRTLGAGAPAPETVTKIYAYIAACGLLWSNWCEYKLSLGVEFGEYSLRQYRFAKDYYKYAAERIAKTGGDNHV